MSDKIRIGISIGDVNGIGVEVILKTFHDNRMYDTNIPVIYASSQVISYYKKSLNLNDLSINIIKNANEAHNKKINLVSVWNNDIIIEPGQSTATGGKYAFESLKAAVEDLASNKIDVLITAPINKKNIQSEEFNFPGHTEYLAHYANEDDPLMIMVAGMLRLGLVSGHIPIKDISKTITKELILKRLNTFNKSLIQDFCITRPKLAVLGLNPHSGDNGMLGIEEQEIIAPAIETAQNEGILAYGPYAADGFFGSSAFTKFDGILAMYHDQGLAPFKAISFDEGVNFTAGLPIVRTSPDHGTGYDIAGKGIASENSFRQAVYLACDVYKKRKEHKILSLNPLKVGSSNSSNGE